MNTNMHQLPFTYMQTNGGIFLRIMRDEEIESLLVRTPTTAARATYLIDQGLPNGKLIERLA